MKCLVCDGPGAEMHFGGLACRACSAFFRRFFHSKKVMIECTCSTRMGNSHPCRYCRIQKCFSIGMTAKKVQKTRDKHSWQIANGKFISSQSTDSSSSSSPSPSSTHLVSRDTMLITWTAESWNVYEQRRSKKYSGTTTEINILEATSHVHYEMEIMWQLVENMFPKTTELSEKDKNALLSNFVPKWWQFEPIIDCSKEGDFGREKCEEIVTSFYTGAFQNGKQLSKKQILKIFKPYFLFYYSKFIQPIVNKKFDLTEFTAICFISFFDSAYTNISEECAEMCRTIRKLILRELKGYQIDNNHDETRLADTMETLPIVERAVEKFEEELMICEMNNVVIHDDFKQVMRQQRI